MVLFLGFADFRLLKVSRLFSVFSGFTSFCLSRVSGDFQKLHVMSGRTGIASPVVVLGVRGRFHLPAMLVQLFLSFVGVRRFSMNVWREGQSPLQWCSFAHVLMSFLVVLLRVPREDLRGQVGRDR